MKHTQGPWQVGYAVDDYGDTEIIIEKITSSGSLLVAVAVGGLLGQEANARLMAAAPELLEALTKLLDMHERCDAGFAPHVELRFAIRDMARAAITKATGEQP
jgi:hypothetical protein